MIELARERWGDCRGYLGEGAWMPLFCCGVKALWWGRVLTRTEALWYSHYDLVSDVGDPFWGRTLVEDFESNVSAGL